MVYLLSYANIAHFLRNRDAGILSPKGFGISLVSEAIGCTVNEMIGPYQCGFKPSRSTILRIRIQGAKQTFEKIIKRS